MIDHLSQWDLLTTAADVRRVSDMCYPEDFEKGIGHSERGSNVQWTARAQYKRLPDAKTVKAAMPWVAAKGKPV